ncbi:hypothetical protein CSN78_000876 [Salmonella enterica subsp. diarizonae]|nr:hypothetical protein [Salmonella enterica subsp. diarizonae]EEG6603224.1 hypothetical protein [Salmonella enterica]EDT8783378.1 hypothetical protein [Salmonella enterica subsp. diarizonae]EDU0338460.1 hypothetical protein [Salmonella enterica subsp. diarizonae]EDU7978746.1 hypothetical protein [Salmonella enterica subsp. diarizonae]
MFLDDIKIIKMRLTAPPAEEKTTPLIARLLCSGENIVNIIYHVIKYHLITMK